MFTGCNGPVGCRKAPAACAIKSCEDAAMNDKTLKCITMMSYEIKAIHRRALCEKYGNNIAHS